MVKELAAGENFDDLVRSGVVIVDFFAEWCGPCRMLAPVVDELSKEFPQVTVMKVNIDDHQHVAAKLGITSIPTIIFFKEGQEVDRVVGLKDKSALANTLSTLI